MKVEMRGLLDELAAEWPNFRYDMRDLFEVYPSMTEADRPMVRETLAAIKTVFDKPGEIIRSPGNYDQKHIDRIGSCATASPTVRAICSWRTSRMNGWVSTT